MKCDLQGPTLKIFVFAAMYGHNFCRAGEQAFKMLASNALRVAAINSVGDFVLWLGKALVVIATILIGVEMLQVNSVYSSFNFLKFDF